MTVSELLPCPFCGGEAEIERLGTPRQSTIYACGNCGCRLETGEEWGHGRQWNARARGLDAAKPEQVHTCSYYCDRPGCLKDQRDELRDRLEGLDAEKGGEAKRDREADRARFPDADFNRWLDEGISDCGHIVWHTVGDVADAWAAWQSRPYYVNAYYIKHDQPSLLRDFADRVTQAEPWLHKGARFTRWAKDLAADMMAAADAIATPPAQAAEAVLAKVANAIAREDSGYSADELNADTRRRYYIQARAAIAAMQAGDK